MNQQKGFMDRSFSFHASSSLSCSNHTTLDMVAEPIEKEKMPLYDCMLLLKPNIAKEVAMDLVSRVGKHVYRRNGVITDMKSFGEVQLGYGIKKLDGRYYKGTLMQMTMMTPPSFNTELHYLNKEDRLLRWLLVKHRVVKIGVNVLGEDDIKNERGYRSRLLYDDDNIEDEDDDDDDEYEVDEQSETKEG